MKSRRVGIWLVGAFGGVGSTVALGIAALRQGLIGETGLVSALPGLCDLDLDDPADFVIGGHDVRTSDFQRTVQEFQRRSNVFPPDLIQLCGEQLAAWSAEVRPGTVLGSGETVSKLADPQRVLPVSTPRQTVEQIRRDLDDFISRHNLEQTVVINVASTEPPRPDVEALTDPSQVQSVLDRQDDNALPASTLYALAAVEAGLAYVNFTPSPGASFPAAQVLAERTGSVLAGQDGKTGETLLKTVLAPMFAYRHLRVLSWVGHNIFGNRDGRVLADPRNKESKVRSKDQVVNRILGYKPQTLVSIEYIESLDDWKTAWDHIHFEGFLGVKMALQFTWQGCDSILAAPLVIDLARLALFAQRQGEKGILRHLACFFKSPMGVTEHDFFKQWQMLEDYAARHLSQQAAGKQEC